jgi:GNAT superfamily N-acetyltransferase
MDDYPQVLKLYNEMYSSKRSLSDFQWLVEDNPAGRATLFIAIIEDRVVGMQSLIPYLISRNGEILKTFKSEDTLVDKSFRGKGIFYKLYEMVHAHAGKTLVWGLTDKQKIFTRVSMPSSERMTIITSVNRPLYSDNKLGLQRFIAKTVFYTFLYLKSSFKTKFFQSEYLQKELDSNDYGNNKLQTFFKEISIENPEILYPHTDFKYLDWRLTKNPNLDRHQIVCSYDNLGNIMICSIIGYKNKNAYWQSFYALPKVSQKEKIAHIGILKEKIFKRGAYLIHSWMFECNPIVSEIKQIFYKASFYKIRAGLWIVHNSEGKDVDAHNLYFSPLLGIR